MADPVQVETQPSVKRARKIAAAVALAVIAISFGIVYGLSLNGTVTVNVMYVNVVLNENGASRTISIQFNHETLSSGEKVYLSLQLNGGSTGTTLNSISSGTPGFTVGSVTPLPITIPPDQHYDLKLFFVTPSHDYAGDITILISADQPQAAS
ncbi:hypothetical protein DMB44_08750 [Thermoplasma sp. Kam2015]|uniref:hypothetical protein n=1 Tax=Thermoplasma sp. Kam2015 TaxID=2094122 RepID=UPI000D966095|nr:hypothetical protein [Thermoplasma sp. Kam2015]PYB67499.1 hypothetical protein DMB44_08750 [Thermoplasma sp. Kam2015]